ncbi:prolyl oligopeptidase family serine peptidase [Dactylosporangium sp. NBC_01737]|uniref:prolyl oligopeptidase family serine peptidase n=1 Tax=Dactylosporangium sp. NBC_01737 TaxID=2975959 RepID=UPI002E0FEF59|nr:prolyl oligopeptidase family serine peptidase [Dactylosporangium sp. NBC_01737]
MRRHPIDRDRILVAGCSNGGYMSLKMTAIDPDLFAASVPICGVVASQAGARRWSATRSWRPSPRRPGSSPRSTTPRSRRRPTRSTPTT